MRMYELPNWRAQRPFTFNGVNYHMRFLWHLSHRLTKQVFVLDCLFFSTDKVFSGVVIYLILEYNSNKIWSFHRIDFFLRSSNCPSEIYIWRCLRRKSLLWTASESASASPNFAQNTYTELSEVACRST